MSEGPSAAGAAHRVGSGTARLVRAWRALPHEPRLAAYASGALFVTLFLPWYQVTLIAQAKTAKLQSVSATITGWGAFSFVEAAVLLVAAGVLVLLFQRAEGRAFHLPGGDGGVISAAGVWACLLVVWRIFDKQGATTNGPSATSSGVEWGIFFALGAAAFLAYSGSRIRAAHRPEPPLPGEDRAPEGSSSAATAVLRPRGDAAARERPSRRARPPMPVPADPPAPSSPPARASAGEPRPRRPRAADLFERVVPDDPPTMPFGRGRGDVAAQVHRPEPPARAPSPATDEQLTIPFGGREDETLPLAADHRSRTSSEDPTVALGLGEDATLPLRDDATVPLRDDETLPLDR